MSSKRETYASITRKINALLDRQERERQRMAGIMATTLLSDNTASQIGDYSDTELRQLMHLLSSHLPSCIAQMENARKARKAFRRTDRTAQSQMGENVSSGTQKSDDDMRSTHEDF